MPGRVRAARRDEEPQVRQKGEAPKRGVRAAVKPRSKDERSRSLGPPEDSEDSDQGGGRRPVGKQASIAVKKQPSGRPERDGGSVRREGSNRPDRDEPSLRREGSSRTDREQEDLPEGWEKVWSAEHKRHYYWHAATKKSAWVRPPPPAKEEIWRARHANILDAPGVRISGVDGKMGRTANGDYLCEMGPDGEAPVYRKLGMSDIFLYRASDGSWRISGQKHMQTRAAGKFDGLLRSPPLPIGKLPNAASSWQAFFTGNKYENQNAVRVKIMQTDSVEEAFDDEGAVVSVADRWRLARWRLQSTPSFLIQGIRSTVLKRFNGQFALAEGRQEEPPVFRNIFDANCWVYYAQDGAWRIGGTTAQCKKRENLIGPDTIASDVMKAGNLPGDESTTWFTTDGSSKWMVFANWKPYADIQIRTLSVANHMGSVLKVLQKQPSKLKELQAGRTAEGRSTKEFEEESEEEEEDDESPSRSRGNGAAFGKTLATAQASRSSARSTDTSALPRRGDASKASIARGVTAGRLEKQRDMGGQSKDAGGEDLTRKPLAKYATEFTPKKRVDDYLLEDCLRIPGMRKHVGPWLDTIIKAAWEILADKAQNGDLKKYSGTGLTRDMAFAVVLFTVELGLELENDGIEYPGIESEFYAQYNNCLRDREPETMENLAGYSHFFFAGLSKLPVYNGVLWRGINDRPAIENAKRNYAPRMKTVHWSAFSSASPDREVACEFAGNSGLVFRIEVQGSARDIRVLSSLDEDERLLLPNVEFVVDKPAFRAQDGLWEVHLVESPGSYRF